MKKISIKSQLQTLRKEPILTVNIYNYYSDINDVMEEIENLVVAAFYQKHLVQSSFTNMADFLTEIFIKFTETVNHDLEFYGLLFKTNNRSFLIVKIVDILKKYVQQRIEETETLDQKRFKVAVDLCIPGIISVYMNWFTNSYDYSIEELSSLLTDFILNGIQKNWPGN